MPRSPRNGLEAEWSRTDETYDQKAAHLQGGAAGGRNGTYVLDNTTVQSHEGQDVLNHSTGGSMDLFFAHLFGLKRDTIDEVMPGEIINEI
jgi:hypothetical protein